MKNDIKTFMILCMLVVLCVFFGYSARGVVYELTPKELVQCTVQGSPMVHGKKLNVIDLTLICDGSIVEVKDQQIGYNFSESGVKRNGTPAPKTAINP